jgi:hypothetical protein
MDYALDNRPSIPGRGKILLYAVAAIPVLGLAQPPV